MTNDKTPDLLAALGDSVTPDSAKPGPVPAHVTPDYALGWLASALEQVAANDSAITDLEQVLEVPGQVIYGVLVHGVGISVSLNVTP
jgi:hypothetical protein